MIKYKTMSDGNKVKIVTNIDGESFEQKITGVQKDKVWVVSSKGNEYPVMLSDRVRMTMSVEVDDVAVIKRFKNGWLVFDVIKKEEESVLSEEEEQIELEKQLKELDDIGWGNY